jgi:ribose 5-phosphate isomerase B
MSRSMTIGFGADNAGADLKNALREEVAGRYPDARIVDFGVADGTDATAYPQVGFTVARAVASGDVDRAVLVCGTGIGMAISANKVPGVRAAVAYDAYSVERMVLSNDCQVLALGARVIAAELAKTIVRQWLGLQFDTSSPSAAKVALIGALELARTGTGDEGGC